MKNETTNKKNTNKSNASKMTRTAKNQRNSKVKNDSKNGKNINGKNGSYSAVSENTGRSRTLVIVGIVVLFVIVLATVIAIVVIATQPKKRSGGIEVKNPLLWTDAADPDVIRVGNAYYMVSTTMHMSPGCPIMKSYDLKNWQTVNYVYDILDDSGGLALRNGENAYAGGSWAATLRYNDGYYYVGLMTYSTTPWHGYIFRTDDIENGKWARAVVDPYYDMSLLFDDDRIYVAYSGGGDLYITELELASEGANMDENTLNGGFIRAKNGGINNQMIVDKSVAVEAAGEDVTPEGVHMYKIDGRYYAFMISHSSKGRTQFCFRSDSVTGSYEGKVVLCDSGIAQGGVFDTQDGDWYSMLFQDHGAVGRIPFIVPVEWKKGWCVFGENGKVPSSVRVYLNEVKSDGVTLSDEFNNGTVNYYNNRYNLDGYSTAISGLSPDKLNEGAGTQAVTNGDFESGTVEPWTTSEKGFWVNGNADLSLSTVSHSGEKSLLVSNRVDRGEGVMQMLSGIKNGRTYEYTASVRYDGENSKAEKTFNMRIKYGDDEREIASVTVRRGEWGDMSGSFTVPSAVDVSSVKLIIGLPFWYDEEVPDGTQASEYLSNIYVDDVSIIQRACEGDYYHDGEYDYNGSNIGLQWQWNHNPDNRYWSLTERNGYLRLTNGRVADDLLNARNTLTQRAYGPSSSAYTAIELGGMNNGDYAGIAALQDFYGFIGVTVSDGQKYIVKYNTIFGAVIEEERIPISQERVQLRVDFVFAKDGDELYDRAYFYYSLDGENWTMLGGSLYMTYRLEHFVGYRFALFSYATESTGGYADFDYFRVSD